MKVKKCVGDRIKKKRTRGRKWEKAKQKQRDEIYGKGMRRRIKRKRNNGENELREKSLEGRNANVEGESKDMK